MRYYDCGNYTNEDNPPYNCKFCGSEQRDEKPRQYETIVITCDGWF